MHFIFFKFFDYVSHRGNLIGGKNRIVCEHPTSTTSNFRKLNSTFCISFSQGKIEVTSVGQAAVVHVALAAYCLRLTLLIYRLSSPGSRTSTRRQNILFLSCHKLLARKSSFWFSCRHNRCRIRNTITACVILLINRHMHARLAPLNSTRHGQKQFLGRNGTCAANSLDKTFWWKRCGFSGENVSTLFLAVVLPRLLTASRQSLLCLLAWWQYQEASLIHGSVCVYGHVCMFWSVCLSLCLSVSLKFKGETGFSTDVALYTHICWKN